MTTPQTAVGASYALGAEAPWETVGDGVRRQILGHGADLMMVRVEFGHAGAVGTPHHHPHRQVTYVAAGSFDVIVDGAVRVLGPGDCFYVAADLVHGVVAREPGTLIDVFTPTREEFLAARG